MKKFLYIIGSIILFLMILFSIPQNNESDKFNLSDTIKNLEGENLISSNLISDPTVLYDKNSSETLKCKFPSKWEYVKNATIKGEKLSMWFTSVSDGKLSISSSESENGKTWNNTREAVLKPGPGWDKIGVETSSVIKDHDGKYRMYYSSSLRNDTEFSIGLATSDDGKSWVKKENPIFLSENAWEKGDPNGVLEPSVIYDSSEKIYKMWYNGLGNKDDKLAFRVGYATSKDGVNWSRHDNPVLEPGQEGTWDDVLVSHVNVVKSKDGYHMFYFGVSNWKDGVAFQKGAVGQAYSIDGINWQKDPNNPIIKPRNGEWDGWTIGGPSALIINGEVWLWYFGNSKDNSYEGRIGLVKGTCI